MTSTDLAAPDAFPPDALPGDSVGDDAFILDPIESGEPEAGRPQHLRVAPKVSREVLRRRRRARLAVFGVAALSAASMFTLVAFHVFAVQSAFQLDKLQTQLNAEQRQYGILRSQVAAASAPEAVARAAMRLGMQRSTNPILLHAPNSAPFGPSVSLPAPSMTPYTALGSVGP